jgi:hypothetical protein
MCPAKPRCRRAMLRAKKSFARRWKERESPTRSELSPESSKTASTRGRSLGLLKATISDSNPAAASDEARYRRLRFSSISGPTSATLNTCNALRNFLERRKKVKNFASDPCKSVLIRGLKFVYAAVIRDAACNCLPCFCASTTAIAAILTISSTVEPRWSTWTDFDSPIRMGPSDSAPPMRIIIL